MEQGKYAEPELRGSTLGVFGCGNIGQLTTRFAAAIGMECMAYDPYLSDEDVPTHVDKAESKEVLFDEASIVCVHAPLAPSTREAISVDESGRLGPSGIFVNSARGEIVDESALVRALEAGDIAGASIDVFSDEPRGPIIRCTNSTT